MAVKKRPNRPWSKFMVGSFFAIWLVILLEVTRRVSLIVLNDMPLLKLCLVCVFQVGETQPAFIIFVLVAWLVDVYCSWYSVPRINIHLDWLNGSMLSRFFLPWVVTFSTWTVISNCLHVFFHWRRTMPSVLWRCWLGGRKGIRPVKNWVVGCWRGYLSGARCRLAYSPVDFTATHCLLLQ